VFRHDPALTHLTATREQVVAVVESINQPQISIPGKAPQLAQAHLVGLRNANGTFSVVVGLFLPHGGENVVYLPERREVALEGYGEAELEGLHFLESMGFMLDNVHFGRLAPEAQEQVLRRLPIFSRPRPAAASGGETRPSPRQALARLLGGF
jgi:hypothetical protein